MLDPIEPARPQLLGFAGRLQIRHGLGDRMEHPVNGHTC